MATQTTVVVKHQPQYHRKGREEGGLVSLIITAQRTHTCTCMYVHALCTVSWRTTVGGREGGDLYSQQKLLLLLLLLLWLLHE